MAQVKSTLSDDGKTILVSIPLSSVSWEEVPERQVTGKDGKSRKVGGYTIATLAEVGSRFGGGEPMDVSIGGYRPRLKMSVYIRKDDPRRTVAPTRKVVGTFDPTAAPTTAINGATEKQAAGVK